MVWKSLKTFSCKLRYERKYKVEAINLALAIQALRVHPASFRTLFPDRTVNNIYFDTPDLTTYRENVRGVSERKKYRIRWYAENPAVIERPRFEIKIKENQLGAKEVLPLDEFSLSDLSEPTQTINQLSRSNRALRPVLMNAYRRSYFATPGQQFRITIDHGVSYFSMLTANRFTKYTIQDQAIIVELKYDETMDEKAVREVMQFLPFRQTKSSKYVTGVNMTTY